MKKKSLFALAAAGLMLSACSEQSARLNAPENLNGEVAVAFNASAPQSSNSPRPRRIVGATGVVDNLAALQASGHQQFGVFAYYTNAGDFDDDATEGSTPNFMYNQLVAWDGTAWGYSPVKYWPNEWATTVEASHTADTPADKLSFFAYAPYVTKTTIDAIADPATETGIVGMSDNDDAGSPWIAYRAATDGGDVVDLMWGVANTDYTSNATAAAKIVDAGFAFKDLVKPTTDTRIPFHFRHALAKFGVTVQLYEQSGEAFDNTNTRVFIETVELSTTSGTLFNTYGKLSLDNTTANEPLWSDVTGIISYSYSCATTGLLNEDIKYLSTGDADLWTRYGTHTGVTETKQDLTATAGNALFVPGASDFFKVHVKYHVITYDPNLDGGYSVVTNDITSDDLAALTLKAGTTSTLNIKLGLRQIKFDVTVEGWEDAQQQGEVILSQATPTYGPFSVGAGTTVNFSPGNLQYSITNGKWRFASNQWTYIGAYPGNTDMTTGVIDLFGWGVADTDPAKHTTTNSDYLNSVTADGAEMGSTHDWGTVAATDLGSGWRTLTKDEWVYLLNSRTTTSGVLYVKATVGGIAGLIILPDDWSTSYHTLASTNITSAAYNTNVITLSDWTTDLEAHNAVFLPAAGYRDGTTVNNAGTYGNYWSSTSRSSDNAYGLNFYASYLYPANNNLNRYYGRSVRLVQE